MLRSLHLKHWKVLFVVILLSNVVAPLLANFDLRFSWYSWGIPLYIFKGFYMGPASLKTSPPLGAPYVRKRVQALLHEM